jgi:UDP-glucose 4-epimerase
MNWPMPANESSYLTICRLASIVGDTGDQNLVTQIIREHNVNSIVHFAAWLVVPDSVKVSPSRSRVW